MKPQILEPKRQIRHARKVQRPAPRCSHQRVGLREGWEAAGRRVYGVLEAARCARAWMRRRVEQGKP
ncbi:MAG: hypothetical protein N2444_06920, partial [Methylocystis sp.]|nr:hypothetical protein [Methylocystis sp.]